MKDELFVRLEAQEGMLNLFKNDFFRLTYQEKDLFAGLYNETFDEKLTVGQLGCSTCFRKAMGRLADAYFAEKTARAALPTEPTEEVNEEAAEEGTEPTEVVEELEPAEETQVEETEEVSNKTSKRGRPKK